MGFPGKVDWRHVQLEPADFERLLYIANDPSWDSLSERTRKPQRVVDKIGRGEVPEKFARKVLTFRRGSQVTRVCQSWWQLTAKETPWF